MTESRAVSVVLAVGMLLAGCIALIAFGPKALDVILGIVVIALILERSSFARADQVQRAVRRDLIARAAIRRRHDREIGEIRYYLAAIDALLRPTEDPAPSTQPIVMPAPDGPVTEPADTVFVIAQAVGQRTPVEQARAEKNAAWVEAELARFDFSGRNR